MWTQILTALLVGLLVAFAFQLLLTSIGVAAGLTALGFRSIAPDNRDHSPTELTDRAGSRSASNSSTSNMGTAAGLSILLTINVVLFSACFMAVKFSQVDTPLSGAIVGIVIWSAYFLILTWVSSTAVSTLVGSLLSATTGGFRRLITTIAAAFKGQDDTPLDREQAIAIIRQEIQQAFNPATVEWLTASTRNQYAPPTQSTEANSLAIQALTEQTYKLTEQLKEYSGSEERVDQITDPVQPPIAQSTGDESGDRRAFPEEAHPQLWETFELYLRRTRSKQLTPEHVQHKLETLLDETFEKDSEQISLLEFDRTKLREVLKQRKGLDKKQRNRILQQIETTWAQKLAQLEADLQDEPEADESRTGLIGSLQPIANYVAQSVKKLDDQLSDDIIDLEPLLQKLSVSSLIQWAVQQQLNQIDWNPIFDRLSSSSLDSSQIEQIVAEVRSTAQQVLSRPQQWTEEYVLPHGEAITEQVIQQVDQFQQNIQQHIDNLKAQTQQQLDNTRKAAATAAWWLSATAFTAAISAAISGALATGMPIPISLGF